MKILVLGGFGFIGTHVTQKLNELEYETIAASRRSGTDLFDLESINECLRLNKPHIIINCAANVGSVNYVSEYAADVISSNIQMAVNLYKSVANYCPQAKIINPLSNCSYPGESDYQKENEWLIGDVHDSVFSYGNAKRIIYLIAKCYQKQFGIISSNFLIPNTFGPGDSLDPNKTHALNGMIVRMINAKINNDEKFEIWGTGKPIREWAYVDDVVNILISGLQSNEDFLYPINLAQNKGFSIMDSAELIKKALKYEGELYYNTKYQDGASVKILDSSIFNKKFPNFKFYDHYKGLEKTINYYKSQIKSKDK